jgi:ADP-ribose pyrophosphatase YjhB (NUDIX family)
MFGKGSEKPARTEKPEKPEKKRFFRGRTRPSIQEIVREPTAGAVIYRVKDGKLEILMIQDAYDRWTVPKGHIEPGETAQETAIREVAEEAGVKNVEPICWLGKIHFNYRREETLVMMTTQIYLFKALGDTDDIQKEEWMKGIDWFAYKKALKLAEYGDIQKLMALGKRRLEQRGEVK